MDNILYITDHKVLAVPILECHEPLINIKDYSELHYGPPPECDLTSNDYTKLRKTVFEKLLQAQVNLPNNWRFRLYEGYRNLTVQQLLFDQEYQRVLQRYPQKTKAFHFTETTRLVSPVINFDGSINIPAHNTGGAVDVEIITEEGKLVDMGMEAKDCIFVDPELCLTACSSISQEAQQNRKILGDAMQAQGFINYPTEWWHFSYGDRYWAYHQPIKQAIYGSADDL